MSPTQTSEPLTPATRDPSAVTVTPSEIATGGTRAAALDGVLVQVANVTVSSLTVSSNAGLTFENGGHYIWNGPTATIFPTATWADGSTCENQGGTATTPTGLSQSFYNFYWNHTAAGSVSLRWRTFSSASEAFETSSRRKISRSL